MKPIKPTPVQVQDEIKALKQCLTYAPKHTAFGDDNHVAIQAQIDFLTGDLDTTTDEFYDLSEHTRGSVDEVESWRDGTSSDPAPSTGWDYAKPKTKGYTLIEVMILAVIVGLIFVLCASFSGFWGTGGFGPTREQLVTVTRCYVDTEGKQSHYMVASDHGMFECDNGWLLGVWNADEIYGKLQAGKSYLITTKGNKVVNMFIQEYPYIVSVAPAPKE